MSPEEFNRAFSSGGVPGLPGSGALSSPEALQRLREQGDLDDFTVGVAWVAGWVDVGDRLPGGVGREAPRLG